MKGKAGLTACASKRLALLFVAGLLVVLTVLYWIPYTTVVQEDNTIQPTQTQQQLSEAPLSSSSTSSSTSEEIKYFASHTNHHDIVSTHHPQTHDFDDKPQVIPRNLMLISPTFELSLKERTYIAELQRANPEYTHYYYDFASAKEFISKRFGYVHVEVFDTLLPYKYKMEFFRYCWLIEVGGVTIDHNFIPLKPLREILNREKDSFVAAVKETRSSRILITTFLAAEKYNDVIVETVEKIMIRTISRDHGLCADCVTGSGVISEAYKLNFGDIAPFEGIQLITAKGHASVFNRNGVKIMTRLASSVPDDYAEKWSELKGFVPLLGENGCRYNMTLQDENKPSHTIPPAKRRVQDMSSFHEPRMNTLPRLKQQRAKNRLRSKKIKIPKTVLQMSLTDQVPTGMRQAMQIVREINPDYAHVYYSDKRIREFLAMNYPERVLTAFDMLIPGAFRSDLFRYCWLYMYGGVYIDVDMVPAIPLSRYLEPTDEFVSAEDNGNGYVYNAFIATIPGHPIIQKAINLSVARILAHRYGPDTLSITGPILLQNAFERHVGERVKPKDYRNGIRILSYRNKCAIGEVADYARNVRLLWTRFPSYVAESRWFINAIHYDTLWNARKIFYDRTSEDKAYYSTSQSDILTLPGKDTRSVSVIYLRQSSSQKFDGKVITLMHHGIDNNLATSVLSEAAQISWWEMEFRNPLIVGGQHGGGNGGIACIKLYEGRFTPPLKGGWDPTELMMDPRIQLFTSSDELIGDFHGSPHPKHGSRILIYNLSKVSGGMGAIKIRVLVETESLSFGEIELFSDKECSNVMSLRDERREGTTIVEFIKTLNTMTVMCSDHLIRVSPNSNFFICQSMLPDPEKVCTVVAMGPFLEEELETFSGCDIHAFDSGLTAETAGKISLYQSSSVVVPPGVGFFESVFAYINVHHVDFLIFDFEGREWNHVEELTVLSKKHVIDVVMMDIHLYSGMFGYPEHTMGLLNEWHTRLKMLVGSFDMVGTKIDDKSDPQNVGAIQWTMCCYRLTLKSLSQPTLPNKEE